jgi:hypothetical protein
MTASFFQTLKACKVQYLLISGQAAVLYGAATFSEDIDIWIQPTQNNLNRFIKALRACKARYYQLTPPLTSANLLKGHGFHFVIPSAGEGDLFLDVMGVPPRVPAFSISQRRSMRMKTHWGILPVINIPDLIELKKTQRLEDYPVIGRLASRYCELTRKRLGAPRTRWAVRHLFSLPELHDFFQMHPDIIRHLDSKDMAAYRSMAVLIQNKKEIGRSLEQYIERRLLQSISDLQRKDRLHWHEIIEELKQLRSRGQLMTEGRRV